MNVTKPGSEVFLALFVGAMNALNSPTLDSDCLVNSLLALVESPMTIEDCLCVQTVIDGKPTWASEDTGGWLDWPLTP